MSFPGDSVVENLPANTGHRFDPWVRKIPWRRKWQATPVFLSEKSHGQRRLVGYSPWGHKRVGHGLVTKQHATDSSDLSMSLFLVKLFKCFVAGKKKYHLSY